MIETVDASGVPLYLSIREIAKRIGKRPENVYKLVMMHNMPPSVPSSKGKFIGQAQKYNMKEFMRHYSAGGYEDVIH